MAYDEQLTNRVREIIAATHNITEEKKMFGGICFMVNDKMCVGVQVDHIMVRIDPTLTDEVLTRNGCEPMMHRGRIMQGFVFVDPDTLKTKRELNYWIQLALEYNRNAPPSKRKKKAAK